VNFCFLTFRANGSDHGISHVLRSMTYENVIFSYIIGIKSCWSDKTADKANLLVNSRRNNWVSRYTCISNPSLPLCEALWRMCHFWLDQVPGQQSSRDWGAPHKQMCTDLNFPGFRCHPHFINFPNQKVNTTNTSAQHAIHAQSGSQMNERTTK